MVKKIAVIGGGAAGMFAAGCAAERGADVTIFEKNKHLGKKMGITGKGRCNVTNNCSVSEFMVNVPTNPKFLYTAIYAFTPADTMAFFEKCGVPLKTERGNRVFPVSDRAGDIVGALKTYVKNISKINSAVTSVSSTDGGFTVAAADGAKHFFDAVIIATGGMSYPLTGSTGDGYAFARSLGHTVVQPKPSLVPVEVKERWCAEMQGLSLKNVSLTVREVKSGNTVYEDFGELLFTHFGLSGPLILSASSVLGDGDYTFSVDLKPALDEKTLDKRILRDFDLYKNKNYANALTDLLPQKLIPVFVRLSGLSPEEKVNSITKQNRQKIVSLMKNLQLTYLKKRPIAEAVITSGGVSTAEINPKTMGSRLINGLYFAGEVIDVDAYTGGFNLQIAFSTAFVAAENAVNYIEN